MRHPHVLPYLVFFFCFFFNNEVLFLGASISGTGKRKNDKYVCNALQLWNCFHIHSFFIYKFIYLFIFGCVGSLLLCAGFLQLWQAGATLHCGVRASHCGGFSCCGARALGAWASVVVAFRLSSCGSRALEHRLSSCGAWASLLCSMWDLPGLGIEPMTPALAGGFLTTAPPGKSPHTFFFDTF